VNKGVIDGMISIVIPVYNRSVLLRRCLESVFVQNFSNFEVVVIDDASSENISVVLSHFDIKRINLIRHPHNRGVSAARNTGVDAARGEYVTFLDSDDVWRKNALSLLHSALIGKSNIDCVFGVVLRRELAGTHYTPGVYFFIGRDDLLCTLSRGCCLHFQGFMARRCVFDRVGVFDVQLRNLEDWDMCLRLANRCSVGVLPKVVTDSYYFPGGLSTSKENLIFGAKYIFDKHKKILAKKDCIENFYFAMAHVFAIYGLSGKAMEFLNLSSRGKDVSFRINLSLFFLQLDCRIYLLIAKFANFLNYLIVGFLLPWQNVRVFRPIVEGSDCD
jgi:glycosyltransferase involved in cell wall biosynthesis